MATRIIKKTWKVGGVLTDVTTAKLSDPTGAYGVKRNDTGAVVVADGTAMTRTALGTYEAAAFTVLAGVSYTAWVEFVYLGSTYYVEEDIPAIAVAAATDPDQTTAYWYVYGNDGALVGSADVTATIEIIGVPSGRGYAYDDTPLTLTSTADGMMSALLFKGAKYKVTLSDNREWTVEVPRNAGATYRLPPIRVVES